MIRARLMSTRGDPTLIFGLSDENLDRLRIGMPIHFELGDLGIKPSIPIIIMAGRDDAAMRAVVAEWFEIPPEEVQ